MKPKARQPISLRDFAKDVKTAMERVNVPEEFSRRYLNEGFSGGEKKRMEILQLILQQPRSWRSSTRPTRDWTSTR